MANKAEQRKNRGEDTIFYFGGREWTVPRVQKSIHRAKNPGNEGIEFGKWLWQLYKYMIADIIVEAATPVGLKYGVPLRHSPSRLHPSSPLIPTIFPGREISLPPRNSPQLHHIRLNWRGHSMLEFEAMGREAEQAQRVGDMELAEKKYKDALDGLQNLLSPTHEKTLAIAYQLAELYAQSDRMPLADQVFESISENLTQRWGLTHEKTLAHTLRVVELFSGWSRTADSMTLLHQFLDRWHLIDSKCSKTIDGPPAITEQPASSHWQTDYQLLSIGNGNQSFQTTDDPTDFDNHLRIANALATNKDDEAESQLLRLIKKCEDFPQPLARQILQTRCVLINFYHQLPNLEKVDIALREAMKSTSSLIDLEQAKPELFLEACINVAGLQLDHGRFKNAEVICQKVDCKSESIFGPDAPRTIHFLIRIGKMYQAKKNWAAAEPWFEHALAASMTRNGLKCKITSNLEDALENKNYSFPLLPAELMALHTE